MDDKVNSFLKNYIQAYQSSKETWNEGDSCVLLVCIHCFEATGSPFYKEFVLQYLDARVMDDGSIPTLAAHAYSLDGFNAGKALFFAFHMTGEQKYKSAIDFHMKRLLAYPRCECGNFVHKEQSPAEIWLEDLYMTMPFYMAYERDYDAFSRLGDISSQFKNVRRSMFDEQKKLYVSGYDESRQKPWCDRTTGLSKNCFLRAIGGYMMALVDCIELCDEQLYEHFRLLVDLLREALKGLLQYQDHASHLFYQLVDQQDKPGNELDTSGSAMIAYTILKGVRLHVLDEKYRKIGIQMFESLVSCALQEKNGILYWMSPENRQDERVQCDLSEEKCEKDNIGAGAFMMAAAEMNDLWR